MKMFATIRESWHPLHRARKWRWFQGLQNRWDPIIRARIPSIPNPIYVRLFAHASLLLGGEALEENIRKRFANG